MNTKMLEKIAFLQCRLCRGYLYVGMPQDIRSISSHMYYYIVVLNSLAKFTGTHRDRSLFSTCSLQLHWKRNAVIYIYLSVGFAKFFRKTFITKNFLQTGFESGILRKMVNRHSYYNKKMLWSRQLFQTTDFARDSVYLRTIDRKLTLNLIIIFNLFTDICLLKYVIKLKYFVSLTIFRKKFGSVLRCSSQ